MRNYQTKANQGGAPDSITSTKLGAGETNSFLTELKTAVIRAGMTPAGADGAGENTTQLAQALFMNAVKASSFLDSGSANAYRLTPISGSSGVLLPGGYGGLNGMRIYFVPSANNTGNTTINIGQTVGTLLGAKKALTQAGAELSSGALSTSFMAAFTYSTSADSGNGAWILDGIYDRTAQFLPLSGGTMTGPIAMGSNKITGLADGTNSGDAVNKGQLDLKLNITGGTMTGPIAMGSNKITGLANGTNSGDAVTKQQLDATTYQTIITKTGSYTLAAGDRNNIVKFGITAAATMGFLNGVTAGAGYSVIVENIFTSSANVTLTSTNNFYGNVNAATSMVLAPGESCRITSDGTNWLVTELVRQFPASLALSGGTMTGFLTLHANPSNALHAATKQYVDANITPDATTAIKGKAALLIASEIDTGTDTQKVATAAAIAGSKRTVKAWWDLNGSTGALVNGFGVTSGTKNSTGNYSINLAATAPHATYGAVATSTQNITSQVSKTTTVYTYKTGAGASYNAADADSSGMLVY